MTVQDGKVRFNIIKDTANLITPHNNEYLFSDDMIPVRKHQAYEEVLQFEKEFAGVIYYQRGKETRL